MFYPSVKTNALSDSLPPSTALAAQPFPKFKPSANGLGYLTRASATSCIPYFRQVGVELTDEDVKQLSSL